MAKRPAPPPGYKATTSDMIVAAVICILITLITGGVVIAGLEAGRT